MKTARKALQLLRQFTVNEPLLGVNELARRMDIDPASAHRLLRSMVEERFIEQDPATRMYRLGLGAVDVAAVRIAQTSLIPIALPHMDRLRDQTGETVALLVADGREAVCLAVVESRNPVRVGYNIGERIPLYGSAGGQVMLANMSDGERQAVYAAGLKPFTPRTITDPARLERALADIREARRGWAEDSYIEGVVSAAAPILDPRQHLAGAVSISAPLSRVDRTMLPDLGNVARAAADAMEAEWAGFAARTATARIVLPTDASASSN